MSNILFVTHSLGFGGAEKILTFVANSLSERGHTIAVVNTNRADSYVNQSKRILNTNVSVYEFSHKETTLQKIKKTIKISQAFNADIIIGFTETPNAISKIVSMVLKIPSIMSERGDPKSTGAGKGFKESLVLKLINASKGGVFQTDGAKAFYGKGLQKRGIVIPNPIFITGEVPFVEYQNREKTVVSVGRLDNFQKRYDVMLKAFKIFSEKHPEYTLKLYGKGNDEEQIAEWVKELELSEKVRLMGLTKQPMQDTCTDGMFLITSDFEGISNSLLEAMAVGLPCVSTDHTPGGARLLISDHKNGLLAPVEDAEKLAAAMCEFADSPELAKKCGENAKDVINRFAPDRIIDMWENYINSLIYNGRQAQ